MSHVGDVGEGRGKEENEIKALRKTVGAVANK